MTLPPAGIPDGKKGRCVQCQTTLKDGEESPFFWSGFDDEERGPFFGYFCSENHRREFEKREQESKLLAAIGVKALSSLRQLAQRPIDYAQDRRSVYRIRGYPLRFPETLSTGDQVGWRVRFVE
jgi:hypothetical protein